MDSSALFIVAQIVGLLYTTACVASVQFRNRRNILLALLVAGLLNNVAMIILGEYSGMAMNTVGILLNIVAYFYSRADKVMPKWLLGIFLLAEIVVCIMTFQNWHSLFVFVAQVAFVFSMGSKKENIVRWYLLANGVLWTVFNVIIGSYGSAIGSAFFTISTLVALVRYKNQVKSSKKHKTSKKNTKKK